MYSLKRIFRDFEEAGALNAHVALYGFWDEGMALTKGGDLALAMKVRGLDYECLDTAARDYAAKRLETALALFDSRFRVYQILFKQNRPRIPWSGHDDPVVNAALRSREQFFAAKANDLYEIELYFVVLYEGFRYRTGLLRALSKLPDSPRAALRELAALYAQGDQTTLIAEQLAAAGEVLRSRVRLFLQNTSDFLGAEMADSEKAFEVFHRLLNLDRGKRDNACFGGPMFLDFQLCDSDVECHRDHLRVGDHYARVLTLKQPPSTTFPVILQKLMEVRANFHAVSEWRLEPAAKTRKAIQSKRRHFHNSKTSVLSHLNTAEQKYQPDLLVDNSKEALIADLGDCMTVMEMNGMQFGEFSLTLLVHGENLGTVEQAEGELMKAFSAHDGTLFAERYNLLNAFFATLPGNQAFNLRRLYLSDANYADLSFLFTIHGGDRTNAHLRRESLAVLETAQGTPYFFNLHHGDIGHTLMVGMTGAGKSFALNFLVQSLQRYDPVTFIFDLGGSFRSTARMFRGSNLEMGHQQLLEGAVRINPFCLPPEPANLQFQYSLVRLLIEGSQHLPLTAADERELYLAIESLYTLPAPNRTLSSLAGILPRALAEPIRRWTAGGQYGFVFDNDKDNLTFSRFQCFNFEGIDAEILEPLLFYILHRANQTLGESGGTVLKAFVMDEAWLFFRNPTVRDYIVEALKTWRKKNAALIVATQSLDELRKSQILDVVVESCLTKIFLANPDLDPELYRRVFHLNDTEMAAIADLVPKRQLLIKRPGLAKVVNLDVDRKSYWLFTNDPYENHRREQAIARFGFEKGLETLANGSDQA